jgi:hypothetical protein
LSGVGRKGRPARGEKSRTAGPAPVGEVDRVPVHWAGMPWLEGKCARPGCDVAG